MRLTSGRLAAVFLTALLLPACGTGDGGGTLIPTVAPGIPTSVEARSGNRRVTLAWSSPGSGSTFVVKRSLTGGGPYFPVSVPGQFPTPTSYVDAGLTNGISYYYVINAVNQFGESAPSAEVGATPGFEPVSVVSGASSNHSLAILPDRTAWSWGINDQGQLGNGFTSGRQGAPVQVAGLDDVTDVATGADFSLASTTDGRVWGWGENGRAQLGLGATSIPPVALPTANPILTDIVAVAASGLHSLALRSDGTVWSWGDNTNGEVGNGTFASAPVAAPIQVSGLTGVTAIAAGRFHSMALRDDGTLWVWGYNLYGQLGTGGPVREVLPVQVPNFTGVTAIACGSEFSVVVTVNGTLFGWGQNFQGQVGIGSASASVARPTPVINITQATAIAAGDHHTVALRSDGSVWAWGSLFYNTGPLETNFLTPFQVANLADITTIAVGMEFTFAVDRSGTLRGWGKNDEGQVGNGTGQTRDLAAPVLNLTEVTSLGTTGETTVARRTDGTVYAWGGNNWGTLGNGATSIFPSPAPTQVPGLTGVASVECGGGHVLALKTDGTVWAWGTNSAGQLGRGSFSPATGTSAAPVINLTNVAAISAGNGHNLALRTDGTVWVWGSNTAGELGNGGTSNSHTPAPIPGLTGVTAVSAGGGFSLALRAGGTVWGWGNNISGFLALGHSNTPVTSPQQMPGVSGMTRISAGSAHAVALDGNGVAWSWGFNHSGQLGNGTTSAVPPAGPVQVLNLTGILDVDAAQHTLARLSDGTVRSWGYNASGQLGSGDETHRSSPVQVVNLPAATGITAGGVHSAAIMPDKTVWAWGGNNQGQLGSPVFIRVLLPAAITQ